MNTRTLFRTTVSLCTLLSACELFVEEEDKELDNVAACQKLEDSLNDLGCLEHEFDLLCESYDDQECSYVEYFNCMAEVYFCEEDTLDCDYDGERSCMELALEAEQGCDAD